MPHNQAEKAIIGTNSPKSGHSALKVEFCICAAVKAEDGTVIRGHRHRDCRDSIVRRGLRPSKRWEDEGFITSSGRFVNREEGFMLMTGCGWTSVNPQGYQDCGWLFSEDLY